MMFSLKPPVASVFHIRRQFERSIRSLISLNIERNGGGGGGGRIHAGKQMIVVLES